MSSKYKSAGNLSGSDRWQLFPSTRADFGGKSATYDLHFNSPTAPQQRPTTNLYTELSGQQRHSYQSDSTSPSSNSSMPQHTEAYGQGELTLYHTQDMADKFEIQSLLAELEASRDLNKTLSLQLAKSERDYQSLKIQQELQQDHTEAVISARITEIISKQYAERKAKLESISKGNGLKRSLSQVGNGDKSHSGEKYASSDNIIDTSYIKDKEMQQIVASLNQSHLSPAEISTSCQAMLQYIRKHGCTVGTRNGVNGDVTSLRKENDKLTTKIAGLSQSLSTTQDVTEKLRRQLDLLSDEKSDLESQRDNMESKVVQLQQQLADLKHTTNTQCDRLLEENRKYLMELTRLKAQLHSTSDAHVLAELEGQKRELSIQLEKLQQEKEELVLQKNTLESRLGDYETQDGSLGRRRSLTAMNGANSPPHSPPVPPQILKELDQLRREKSSLTAELTAAYSSLQDIQDGTHRLTGDLTDKLNAELMESAQLRQQLNAVNDKCKYLQAETEKLKSVTEQKTANDSILEQLKTENTQLTSRLSSLEAQLIQTELELNSSKVEVSTEAEKLQKLNNSNNQLTAELNRSAQSSAVVSAQLLALQSQLSQAETKLEQMRKEKSDQLSKTKSEDEQLVSTLRTQLSGLEADIDAMKRERESLKDTLAKQSEALMAAKTAVSQSTAQLDSFNRSEKDLEKLRGKYEQQEAKWQYDLYELRQKYSEAEAQNFQAGQELLQLRRDTQDLKDKLARVQRDGDQLASDKAQLEARLKAAESQPTSSSPAGQTVNSTAEQPDSVKLLRDEYKKLAEKNEEQKRLITVLRRKLGSLTPHE